ncbi:MAG: arginine--tRNA ligase [Candidatus Magasanikbacteria bacterium RIFCSPHIGHO2_01_FULL_33_34]|uniref:Arginine--tRNA ligase n=1 Tax=Candidatus Magasanikbacteria bacterium RIFCSPHIGHO2_01_FULL_33_34 TaxID=1798671 RepID=A0A1F6LGP7_9BACT|nr:MAG: arginine--tRNA ligase [Candidatus Magasanikbacteria bacterium RIFCSPHIGHO2_01_FULL_33_34]OGH66069.1 MAG: arginine--tRNA ligase [Candidatus Magasanikbacteria bacterium RIFCSPHIGHO2_02_FULL_33_17]OGH75915.1 MAG: arginine--tRNA ligase [Candidatus Magasanikbacteria bacterium RIFCSPLOWO2_01_FULL_33_34]OGH81692.1 MAG: arginine--tRNA ligase [Candidatus Magasanikbacteria bacterium RIFCSPLOWO2_12_FULL_34_7]
MLSSLKQQLIKALYSAGVTGSIELVTPPKPEMGEFAFACFNYAKKLNLNPAESAKILVEDLQKEIAEIDILDKVEAVGPYVNFYLNSSLLAEKILGSITPDYGKQEKKNKKVLIEYAQPNTHKAFHIGHLRGTITGESLSRIMEMCGYNVVRVNYQGDVGMHIAKAIWAIIRNKEKYDSLKHSSVEEKVQFLGMAYADGAKAFESDEKSKAEIVDINAKIYKQDKSIKEIYGETRAWSLEYFDKIYIKLDTHFDRLFFESEVFERAIGIVKNFLIEHLFAESEGAIIYRGSTQGLHDRVFLSSMGLPTYEAKDLALAELQFKEFNPDKIIHVIAREQTEYLRVIFQVLERTLPNSRGKESHLAFGWVSLKSGKMSSRSGQVVLAEDLINDINKKILGIMEESDIKNKEFISEKVSLGALKYSFLKTGVHNDIVFDLEESVSLSGDSGPYLMYIVARINRILDKAGSRNFFKKLFKKKNVLPKNIDSIEKQLLMKLAEFNDIIKIACDNHDPSKIAQYLFSVAQLFNNFYHELPILKAENEDKKFRIEIIKSVHIVMTKGLYLLGISTVKEM